MKLKVKILIPLLILILSFVLPTFNNTCYAVSEPTVYSPNCILMDAKTGKIIYSKDAYTPVPPASTTKIMTALLTLENCQLTDTATVSHEAIYTIPLGYTHAYLNEGEILTINQLLNILLIPSANDAANVLAEHIAGSTSSFATMMNTRAKELGCKNTNFVNANGIQADDHYSSAYDLAIIAREAMKYETFRKIVTTKSYTLPATNMYETADRYFKNTNQLIHEDDRDSVDNYYYQYATGIKTGYTSAAGDCIVASAKKGEYEYILVILGGDKTENGLSERYIDCKTLFEYAFNNFKNYTVNYKDSVIKQVTISDANIFDNKLDLIINEDIDLILKNDTSIYSITPKIEITSDLIAPISKNSVIGTITYDVDGNTYSYNLYAAKDIQKSNLGATLLIILFIILVLFLFIKLIKLKNKKKKNTKKKNTNNYMYW